MGNLDWENVKGNQKKPAAMPQAPEKKDANPQPKSPEGKLESPYRKGEDAGLDPKENHSAHDAIAGEETEGIQQNADTGSQPQELA